MIWATIMLLNKESAQNDSKYCTHEVIITSQIGTNACFKVVCVKFGYFDAFEMRNAPKFSRNAQSNQIQFS